MMRRWGVRGQIGRHKMCVGMREEKQEPSRADLNDCDLSAIVCNDLNTFSRPLQNTWNGFYQSRWLVTAGWTWLQLSLSLWLQDSIAHKISGKNSKRSQDLDQSINWTADFIWHSHITLLLLLYPVPATTQKYFLRLADRTEARFILRTDNRQINDKNCNLMRSWTEKYLSF